MKAPMKVVAACLASVSLLVAGVSYASKEPDKVQSMAEDVAVEAVRRNPIEILERPSHDDETFVATVEEMTRTGGYTYLRVDESGRDRWIVTVSKGMKVGDKVVAKNMGMRKSFDSPRLHRHFDELAFCIVHPEHAPSKPR